MWSNSFSRVASSSSTGDMKMQGSESAGCTTSPSSATARYRRLDAIEVLSTSQSLLRRITERFPSSDLLQVCNELTSVAAEAQARAEWLGRPIKLLRIVLVAFLLAFVALFLYSFSRFPVVISTVTLPDLLQGVEAATNELLILGAGLVFLWNVEIRIKRSRGLLAIHELRSMAHIIDMHQLTKDPARLERAPLLWTPASPKVSMDAFLLSRYLDYCSEMLSLIGKVAALYAQDLADPVLLSAVDEVEALTNGFSRKIWQKIMIIGDATERDPHIV